MKSKFAAFFALGILVLFITIPHTIFAHPALLSQDSTKEAVEKERGEKLKLEFKEIKEEFQKARIKLSPKSTEGAKKDVLLKAKEAVLKILDRTIERLENLLKRVEKSPVLTDERKAQISGDIKTQISLIEAQKAKINSATNVEELRTLLKETRTQLASVREAVKKIVAQILASHIDRIIIKLEDIANRLENQINNLKTYGADVSKLQTQLAEARAKIAQSKEANNSGDWKTARKKAEEARAILVKLRGQIKAQQAKLKIATKSATEGGSI